MSFVLVLNFVVSWLKGDVALFEEAYILHGVLSLRVDHELLCKLFSWRDGR